MEIVSYLKKLWGKIKMSIFYICENYNREAHDNLRCTRLRKLPLFRLGYKRRIPRRKLEHVFFAGYRPCPKCMNIDNRFIFSPPTSTSYELYLENQKYIPKVATSEGEYIYYEFMHEYREGDFVRIRNDNIIFDTMYMRCYIFG